MASVRSLDNALEVRPGVKITDDFGVTQIPNNGRIMRNLIEGADLVMSNITHFYHLSALDFVNASPLGPFFAPTYTGTDSDMLPDTFVMSNGTNVVANYVQGLDIRRKCHAMGAVLSGRQPHQNAIVPGGVTTIPTASDMAVFDSLLTEIRTFIDTAYIPDVLTVALTATSTYSSYTNYWLQSGSGNCIAYGIFPCQSGSGAEQLLIARGVCSGTSLLTSTGVGPTELLGYVIEDTTYSYYNNTAQGLHPHQGQTNPDVSLVVSDSTTGGPYSWLKSPRFLTNGTQIVCEVGPLARMVVSYFNNANLAKIAVPSSTTAPLALPSPYSASDIVGAIIPLVPSYGNLYSTFGRHAARAIETKLIADAMAVWSNELQNNGLTQPTYIYAKLPTKPAKGAGWTEAPRGALGHWITIEKKKIVNYQCVVPTTWNHSPKDSLQQNGPAEDVLIGTNIGTSSLDQQEVNIIRALHPFDFCIACAVHMVRPDGTTISKFKLDTDGKVTRLPHDAEI